jgi:hypothetical protein
VPRAIDADGAKWLLPRQMATAFRWIYVLSRAARVSSTSTFCRCSDSVKPQNKVIDFVPFRFGVSLLVRN